MEMNKKKIKDQYNQKIILVKKYNKHYYDNNNSIVTDQEFDLLKIDTEGHEFQVLMGAKKTINENKIGYILIEIHSSKMYKNYSKSKIEEFLKKNNFTLLKSFK